MKGLVLGLALLGGDPLPPSPTPPAPMMPEPPIAAVHFDQDPAGAGLKITVEYASADDRPATHQEATVAAVRALLCASGEDCNIVGHPRFAGAGSTSDILTAERKIQFEEPAGLFFRGITRGQWIPDERVGEAHRDRVYRFHVTMSVLDAPFHTSKTVTKWVNDQYNLGLDWEHPVSIRSMDRGLTYEVIAEEPRPPVFKYRP